MNSDGGFSGSSVGKETDCNAGDQGLIPGLGKFPGEGNGNHSAFLPGTFNVFTEGVFKFYRALQFLKVLHMRFHIIP